MKRTWVKSVVLFMAILFIFSLTFGSQVFATSEVERASKSVVQIAWKLPNTEAWRDVVRNPITGEFRESDLFVQMGSGFLVGVDDTDEFRYVVTNYHVVNRTEALDWQAPFRVNREDEIGIYLVRARDDYVPLTTYDTLMTTDLAIMEIDPRHRLFGYEVLELGHIGMVNRGDDIYAIGFPTTAQVATDLTSAHFTDSTITKGIVSRITTADGVPVIQSDTTISGGNSGGPMVNKDGVVVGIVSFGIVRPAGGAIIPLNVEYAIQIDELTSFLRSRGIPFKEAGAAPVTTTPEPALEPTPEPTPEPAPILTPEPPVETTQPVVEQESGIPVLYLALGGAALLLIVVLAVVLSKGKKPAAVAAGPAMPPPPVMPSASTQGATAPATQASPGVTAAAAPVTKAKAAGPKAAVKGISGQFAGQTIELVQGQLVIGRDPKAAQLVYPQSTDDISRKHVTIRYEEGTQKFTLEDSSSNGTFLMSNQRLESGKLHYMSSGERFYLADSKEVFELVALN